VPSQHPKDQLQIQHSLGTGNYVIDKHKLQVRTGGDNNNNNNNNYSNSIQFNLFTCKLNSLEINYKARMSREEKTHIKTK
jgi:hypothetical protein